MPFVFREDRMNWVRLAAVIVGAGVVTSFTDWFFAGVFTGLRRSICTLCVDLGHCLRHRVTTVFRA
jgi:hypothetical protein